ncbi:MAG: hypothetical protein WAV45_10985 [Propionibacteriaceae bacterium]|jgi:hypothetical protein|nr:hypothetical protein [Micropruina sp.]HBX80128.1 hypothetical protein [Propionibacteriaceae bacterium]HBY24653.1 hypothetical protein [Propionibacteriaceae bacterium]
MKLAKRLAAAAGVVVLLAGCASGNPNDVAVVNGQSITQAQIDAVTPAVVAILPPTSARTASLSITNAWLQAKVAKVVADANGVTVSDIQRQQVIASSQTLAKIAEDPAAKDFVNALADQSVIAAQMSSEAFIDGVQDVSVTVNPRFGTWSGPDYALMPNGGALSKLAPATATASTNG